METSEVSVIQQLIDMDKNARRLVEEAEMERRRTELALAGEKTKLESDIMTKAQSRIEKIKTQTNDESQRETHSIEDEGRQMLMHLEQSFAANRQQWEDALFARCIELPQ